MKRIKTISVLILSVALVFTFAVSAYAVQTPGEIVRYGTHYYQLVETEFKELTWTKANEAAEGMAPFTLPGSPIVYSPHLVTVTSQGELDFLKNMFNGYGWLWTGLYQVPDSQEPGGGWFWVTGEPVATDFWVNNRYDPGEPNNSGGNESYGEWNFTGWNDINNAGRESGFIVEYEAVIPENVAHPAAPAVAASILKALGIRPKYDGGNYIKDVADMMGSQENDENGSWFMGTDKCDVVEYYHAVYDYLELLGAF